MNISPEVHIRALQPDDRQQVTRFWSDVFPDDPPRNSPDLIVNRKLQLNDELLLVACIDSEVLAAIVAGYDGVRGWLYHLALASTLLWHSTRPLNTNRSLV